MGSGNGTHAEAEHTLVDERRSAGSFSRVDPSLLEKDTRLSRSLVNACRFTNDGHPNEHAIHSGFLA